MSVKDNEGNSEGFAITCGDDRIGSILAISDSKSNITDSDEPLPEVFLTNLECYIEETAEIYNSITETDIQRALQKPTMSIIQTELRGK